MGYTVYWDYNKENRAAKFPADFLQKVNKIIANAKKNNITLADWSGDEANGYEITETSIIFNGVRPECCETFRLLSSPTDSYCSDFCKTRQFPYDAVIKAILITALDCGILSQVSGDDGEINREQLKKLLT